MRASRGSDLFSPPTLPAGAVDGEPWNVDEREAGFGEHGLGKTGDPADHVEADPDAAAEDGQLVDQPGDGCRSILQPAVDEHDGGGVDGRDPVDLLGDVDRDCQEFRVGLGIVGSKEPRYAATQRAEDS